MKTILISIFVGLVVMGFACRPETIQDETNPILNVPGTYRFLSLGDSYTIGESVDAADRWSVILADLLRAKGVSVASPEVIARTGWTTAELSDGIKDRNPKGPYDLVSLLIGVNNQYRKQSMERYRTEFRALLVSSIDFAGGRADRVFVLSIPDWGVTPFASGFDSKKIGTEIDAFNQVAQEECAKLKVAYVDITPLSRTAANDRSQIAGDGLHFSGKMYRQWAEKALPTAQGLLEKK